MHTGLIKAHELPELMYVSTLRVVRPNSDAKLTVFENYVENMTYEIRGKHN